MKLLVVEDDSFFALRIREFLVDHGIECDVVRTAQDAVQADIADVDGAIVDIMLPNDPEASGIPADEARGGHLAGVAVVRRFKQRKPDFPVVLLSAEIAGGEGRRWAKDHGYPFVFKHEDRGRVLNALADLGLLPDVPRPRAFIVHGHDEGFLAETKDYLQNRLGWPEPIVLRDQPNAGKTIIEKFEEHAGIVDWVFVLMSPDDVAFSPTTDDDMRRARQNVVFELGFFYGLIGRHEGRTIVLKKGDVELPSDIQGIVWIDVTNGILNSGEQIRREVGM